MKKNVLLLGLTLIVGLLPIKSQATFSIVAVDSVTGAIGGAGASCIAGSQIINDIIEGIGAIHTQAWYFEPNQVNAHNLMLSGLDPDSILGWLYANDAGNRPSFRQYGVVTMAGPGTSASFTGADTDNWKGHITGPGYAIQGNILLGPQIIGDMETAYLNTDGPLEEKLMAALEAAKVPGADTRCLSDNKSSISAFIKIVELGDGGTPYLDIVIPTTGGSTDPIDLLRDQYDQWKAAKLADADLSTVVVEEMFIEADGMNSTVVTVIPINFEGNPPTEDLVVTMFNPGGGTLSTVTDNGDGSFSATLTPPTTPQFDTISASVESYGQTVFLNQIAPVLYYRCGDVDNSLEDPIILDILYLVAYLFQGGPVPTVVISADVNGSGGPPDVVDLVYLVAYLFQGGPLPICWQP